MLRPSGILFLSIIILSAVSFAFASPEDIGLPSRLRSLTDLTGPMERKDITPEQKAEVLISWLKQELADPSPTTTGLGGGLITSGYIRAQLIQASVYGDALVINKAAYDKKNSSNLRDELKIALGFAGDERQVSKIIHILRTHKDPNIRAVAARALGNLGLTKAVPALENALKDEYFDVIPATMKRGTEDFYPVRVEAQGSLRMLRDSGRLEQAKARREAFAKHLVELQKPNPSPDESLTTTTPKKADG